MRVGIFCFTAKGAEVAKRIVLPHAELLRCGSRRAQGDGILPMGDLYARAAEWYQSCDALIFVGACGIAVRAIAPLVADKFTDPAVLVVDELGHHVISLLSGHVGGGNALAMQVAALLQAEPVITTATDIEHRFAVDVYAQRNGLLLDDRCLAKEISAAVLHGEPIGFSSDYPVEIGDWFHSDAELGICISHRKNAPFARTLFLRPKNLVLGVGCRQGATLSQLEAAAEQALFSAGLTWEQVCLLTSIDRKAQEPAILSLCEKYQLPSMFYSAEQLRSCPGSFTASAFVEQTVGVDNVCERSAVWGGNRLLVPKTIASGATAAVAERPLNLERIL